MYPSVCLIFLCDRGPTYTAQYHITHWLAQRPFCLDLMPQFVGEPLLYVQQFVMTVHISPWKLGLQSNEVIREAMKPAFHMTQSIKDFQHQERLVFSHQDSKLKIKNEV